LAIDRTSRVAIPAHFSGGTIRALLDEMKRAIVGDVGDTDTAVTGAQDAADTAQATASSVQTDLTAHKAVEADASTLGHVNTASAVQDVVTGAVSLPAAAPIASLAESVSQMALTATASVVSASGQDPSVSGTAGAAYTATEQGMINDCASALNSLDTTGLASSINTLKTDVNAAITKYNSLHDATNSAFTQIETIVTNQNQILERLNSLIEGMRTAGQLEE